MEEGPVHGGPGRRRVKALIISTTKFGFFVELEGMYIEGLVPLDTLPGDRYAYNEKRGRSWGSGRGANFRSAIEVTVRLDRIDPIERKLQFGVVEPEQRRAGRRRSKRG